MTCARWEERLALSVEGDLPAREAAALEGHLAGCAACREFRAALAESQEAVKALGAEPVDGAVLEAVRGRVMAQAAREPARAAFARWGFAVPLAVAGALAVAIFWPGEVAPPPAAVAVIPLAPAAPRIVWAKHVPRRRAAPRHVARVAAPTEPLLMRIETDDPNVVIYWIVEGKQRGD